MNSSYLALIKRAEDKYEALDGIDQGGITYLKIALDEMFNMSDVVITSLLESFNNFARDGVAKYPSEKVALLVQKINAVTERLAEVPALPRDMPLLILNGFTKCIVPEFVVPFELMINTERVIQLENEGYRHDDRICLENVKKLTLLASNSLHSLNDSNHWNIIYNHWHGMAKGKGPCDNCGGEQYSPDFPHPRDEDIIKKAKEERADRRGGGGRNGGRGGGQDVGRQCDRNKWINYKRGGDRNDYGNGVQKRGNAWM